MTYYCGMSNHPNWMYKQIQEPMFPPYSTLVELCFQMQALLVKKSWSHWSQYLNYYRWRQYLNYYYSKARISLKQFTYKIFLNWGWPTSKQLGLATLPPSPAIPHTGHPHGCMLCRPSVMAWKSLPSPTEWPLMCHGITPICCPVLAPYVSHDPDVKMCITVQALCVHGYDAVWSYHAESDSCCIAPVQMLYRVPETPKAFWSQAPLDPWTTPPPCFQGWGLTVEARRGWGSPSTLVAAAKEWRGEWHPDQGLQLNT